MSERYILVMKDVPNEDFSPLEPEFKLVFHDRLSREEASDILPNTEAIIATDGVSSEIIAKALKLKVIVVNGAGYDDVDVAAATALHIPVYNIPDMTGNATAELALALMLSVSRRVSELNEKMRSDPEHAHEWIRIGQNAGHTLFGKTLGIIGMGNIGSKLSRMAVAMGMKVLYTQRHQLPIGLERMMRYFPLKDLLASSDVVSINCPLTDETRGMIGEKEFMRMKTGSILINTARGEIVDQRQLIRFLKSGKLLGAGLDVFPNNNEIDPELLRLPNVVVTPHIGVNTVEDRRAMAERIITIVQSVCDDLPVLKGNLINFEGLKTKNS